MEQTAYYAKVAAATIATVAVVFLSFVLALKPLTDWAFSIEQEDGGLFIGSLAVPIILICPIFWWLCKKEHDLLTLPVLLCALPYCIYVAMNAV